MFVSVISEVDVHLSEAHSLIVKVNQKLSQNPNLSRKEVLSRIQLVLNEMQWMVSLADELDEVENSSVSSLQWDTYDQNDFYKIAHDCHEEIQSEDDRGQPSFSTNLSEYSSDAEAEDLSQTQTENVNYFVKLNTKTVTPEAKKKYRAPILIPPFSSSDEDADDEEEDEDKTHGDGAGKTVPDETKDDGKAFISKVTSAIENLAPRSTYHITRPRLYTVDLSKVNVRFLSHIPRPDLYYVHGCPDEAEAAEMEKYKKPRKLDVEYGFLTDHGVVPVPDKPVHGHTWSHHFKRWVLHAVPDDYYPGPPPSRQRGRFRG